MKILSIFCLLSVISCEPVFASQSSIGPYSKQREINGQECQLFYVYENGQEKFINATCN